jgi:hypothetical protein
MKYCPACNFTFPDSHVLCDFDGAELVQDSQQQSLTKVPKRSPHPRFGLKKAMLVTSLAVMGLFVSAVIIGYLKSPIPSIPVIVKNQGRQDAPLQTPVSSTSSPSENVEKTEPLKRTGNRSLRVASSSKPRLRQRPVADDRSRNDVIARTEVPKHSSSEKSPKVVAILKTTWKVLKKPFDF